MRAVLVFLQPELTGMTVDVFGDNEGAKKAIANSPSSAFRSKHIDVKLHFIRGLVRAGEVSVLLFILLFSVPYFGLAFDHGNKFLCLEE